MEKIQFDEREYKAVIAYVKANGYKYIGAVAMRLYGAVLIIRRLGFSEFQEYYLRDYKIASFNKLIRQLRDIGFEGESFTIAFPFPYEMIVSERDYAKIVDSIRNPAEPTPALRALFQEVETD